VPGENMVSQELGVIADKEKSSAGSDLPLRTVLAAVASILRDSTGRFEETSDRIAQLVVARETGTGVDIIVALQEFDRLRQDFDAIESILAGCAKVIERQAGDEPGHPFREVIDRIPVVDFKTRLARRLAWVAHESYSSDMSFVEEAIF
jgi:hypothetical protein